MDEQKSKPPWAEKINKLPRPLKVLVIFTNDTTDIYSIPEHSKLTLSNYAAIMCRYLLTAMHYNVDNIEYEYKYPEIKDVKPLEGLSKVLYDETE